MMRKFFLFCLLLGGCSSRSQQIAQDWLDSRYNSNPHKIILCKTSDKFADDAPVILPEGDRAIYLEYEVFYPDKGWQKSSHYWHLFANGREQDSDFYNWVFQLKEGQSDMEKFYKSNVTDNGLGANPKTKR